ncbi:division/cell wall cluster transcriptional repressor MraZ [Jiella marina]|uniref:division/cell wall cluster transcriptional repressor MraZ n=1 Tax=Jiella sp. LLJ827 TaxID=2917712 RepID=UPI002101BFE1|nr:division/cell wall cluster transcriptional repressor MraZ [Jiella sp. LLJ827]MCQ0989991.1 division/cell wall cluster transcriptional repressor MraZ [Jiella sp. LLJ827]
MDRFLSSYVHNIDAKGRVSVPSSFRQVIASRGIRELFAMRSLSRPAIDVGGPELMEHYERQMEAVDPFSDLYQDLALYAYGDGAYLKFDTEGRIQMTDFIRAHTGITDRVAFVGVKHSFQLWDPERFEAFRSQSRERLQTTLQNRQGFSASAETPE